MRRVELHLAESGIRAPSEANLEAMRTAGVDVRFVLLGSASATDFFNLELHRQAFFWFSANESKDASEKMAAMVNRLLQPS
jgi:hypothetical protein